MKLKLFSIAVALLAVIRSQGKSSSSHFSGQGSIAISRALEGGKFCKNQCGSDNVRGNSAWACSCSSNCEENGNCCADVCLYCGSEDGFDFCPEGASTKVPTDTPTEVVMKAPTIVPTQAQTDAPTQVPTNAPTKTPTDAPTDAPTKVPTNAPTETPTDAPTKAPSYAPTKAPTDVPTQVPTDAPTKAPTDAPTKVPTGAPTKAPTLAPTDAPTKMPTGTPTEAPTPVPSIVPTLHPTELPGTPTESPTPAALTEAPTYAPTRAPTKVPTKTPTDTPTRLQIGPPTKAPTDAPTKTPTRAPTDAPTKEPIDAPTQMTTSTPTEDPTEVPSEVPTLHPTELPGAPNVSPSPAALTEAPTDAPTKAPTEAPTLPTDAPTQMPTSTPTEAPTGVPSEVPTLHRTELPGTPTASPTPPVALTEAPTDAPTKAPTEAPTVPTDAPTQMPTSTPAEDPTEVPSEVPTLHRTELPGAPNASPSPAALTEAPTDAPTKAPTEAPTVPTDAPTQMPTSTLAEAPTGVPSEVPTLHRTELPGTPTASPTPPVALTEAPTDAPTKAPTEAPTKVPTEAPTKAPTKAPAQIPTGTPTDALTLTDAPTKVSAGAPTETLTMVPTGTPTEAPTGVPSEASTLNLTELPETPTESPSPAALSEVPTQLTAQTGVPSEAPTPHSTELPGTPTESPTPAALTETSPRAPTAVPTHSPTIVQTDASTKVSIGALTETATVELNGTLTEAPTGVPSKVPTPHPTELSGTPTESPSPAALSEVPTRAPTEVPTHRPTTAQTYAPTTASTGMVAFFSSCGRYIYIQLEEQSLQFADFISVTPFECSLLFSNGLSNTDDLSLCSLMGGQGNTSIVASLSPGATALVPGDKVLVGSWVVKCKNNTTGLCDLWESDVSVVVQAPSNPVTPTVILRYQAQVSPFCNMTIDATGSRGTGGRMLALAWAARRLGGGGGSTGADGDGADGAGGKEDGPLTAYLAGARGAEALAVPRGLLRAGATYAVQVNATNFLGGTSTTEVLVEVMVDDIPKLFIAGGFSHQLYAYEDFQLFADAEVSDCQLNRTVDPSLEYKWELQNLDLDSDSKNPRFFSLPSFALEPNSTHQVFATVTDSDGFSSTATINVQVLRGGVVASIKSGDRLVSPDSNLVLDASSSYHEDSNTPDALAFAWECRFLSGGVCPFAPPPPGLSPRWEVASAELVPHAEYHFAVTVTAPSSPLPPGGGAAPTATAAAVIRVSGGTLLGEVAVAGYGLSSWGDSTLIPVRVDPTKRVVLEGRVAGLEAGKAVHSSWRETGGVLGETLANVSLTLIEETVMATGTARSHFLVLPAGTLTSGVEYTFELHGGQGANVNEAAYSSVQLVANAPPALGVLEVTPQQGIATVDTFTLIAKYFVDDADDYPLAYTFWYEASAGPNNGTARPLGIGGTASNVLAGAPLPPGGGGSGGGGPVPVGVRAADRWGAAGTARAAAAVAAPGEGWGQQGGGDDAAAAALAALAAWAAEGVRGALGTFRGETGHALLQVALDVVATAGLSALDNDQCSLQGECQQNRVRLSTCSSECSACSVSNLSSDVWGELLESMLALGLETLESSKNITDPTSVSVSQETASIQGLLDIYVLYTNIGNQTDFSRDGKSKASSLVEIRKHLSTAIYNSEEEEESPLSSTIQMLVSSLDSMQYAASIVGNVDDIEDYGELHDDFGALLLGTIVTGESYQQTSDGLKVIYGKLGEGITMFNNSSSSTTTLDFETSCHDRETPSVTFQSTDLDGVQYTFSELTSDLHVGTVVGYEPISSSLYLVLRDDASLSQQRKLLVNGGSVTFSAQLKNYPSVEYTDYNSTEVVASCSSTTNTVECGHRQLEYACSEHQETTVVVCTTAETEPRCILWNGTYTWDPSACHVTWFDQEHTLCQCTSVLQLTVEDNEDDETLATSGYELSTVLGQLGDEIGENFALFGTPFEDSSAVVTNSVVFATVGAFLIGIPCIAFLGSVWVRKQKKKNQEERRNKRRRLSLGGTGTPTTVCTTDPDHSCLSSEEEEEEEDAAVKGHPGGTSRMSGGNAAHNLHAIYERVMPGLRRKGQAAAEWWSKLAEESFFLQLFHGPDREGGSATQVNALWMIMTTVLTMMFWDASLLPLKYPPRLECYDYTDSSTCEEADCIWKTGSCSFAMPGSDLETTIAITVVVVLITIPTEIFISMVMNRSILLPTTDLNEVKEDPDHHLYRQRQSSSVVTAAAAGGPQRSEAHLLRPSDGSSSCASGPSDLSELGEAAPAMVEVALNEGSSGPATSGSDNETVYSSDEDNQSQEQTTVSETKKDSFTTIDVKNVQDQNRDRRRLSSLWALSVKTNLPVNKTSLKSKRSPRRSTSISPVSPTRGLLASRGSERQSPRPRRLSMRLSSIRGSTLKLNKITTDEREQEEFERYLIWKQSQPHKRFDFVPFLQSDMDERKTVRERVKSAMRLELAIRGAPDLTSQNVLLLRQAHDDYLGYFERRALARLVDAAEDVGGGASKRRRTCRRSVQRAVWVGLVLYCLVSGYYICLFGIRYGPEYTNVWLQCFVLALLEDLCVILPLKLAFLYLLFPKVIHSERIDLKRLADLPPHSVSVQAARTYPNLIASKLILYQDCGDDMKNTAPDNHEASHIPKVINYGGEVQRWKGIRQQCLVISLSGLLLLPAVLQDAFLDSLFCVLFNYSLLGLATFFSSNPFLGIITAVLFPIVAGVLVVFIQQIRKAGVAFSSKRQGKKQHWTWKKRPKGYNWRMENKRPASFKKKKISDMDNTQANEGSESQSSEISSDDDSACSDISDVSNTSQGSSGASRNKCRQNLTIFAQGLAERQQYSPSNQQQEQALQFDRESSSSPAWHEGWRQSSSSRSPLTGQRRNLNASGILTTLQCDSLPGRGAVFMAGAPIQRHSLQGMKHSKGRGSVADGDVDS